MKTSELSRELKLTYSYVIKGYSKRLLNDDIVYLKHYNETELGALEYFFCEAYDQAKESGLPTEDQKRKDFIDSGEWSQEEEDRHEYLKKTIDNQERQLAQIFLESQRKDLREKLKVNKEEFEKLEEERSAFRDNTCEDFASRKYGEVLATNCLYKNDKLKKKYYTPEQIEFLSPKEFTEIVRIFNAEFNYFSLKNIKRIAASPFFFNPFLHCKNNPFYLFGKPACALTLHQLNLLSYAATFKSILENGKTPPDETTRDIDKLVDWYEVVGGTKAPDTGTGKATPKRETQASGLVGATKEELNDYAAATGGKVVDLQAELEKVRKEKGAVSTMDFKDILDKYK